MLSGIETAAAKAGYNIIVAQSNESYEQEVKIVHSFLAARVCGVIASLAKNTEQYDHYQELLNNDIPIVFYDRICTELKTERVVVDDYAVSSLIAKKPSGRLSFSSRSGVMAMARSRLSHSFIMLSSTGTLYFFMASR